MTYDQAGSQAYKSKGAILAFTGFKSIRYLLIIITLLVTAVF